MYNRATWTKRQKILLILTAITFGILVWQIYSLVRSDLYPTSSKNNASSILAPQNPAQGITGTGTTGSPGMTDSANMTTATSDVAKNPNAVENAPQEINQLPAQIYQDQADFSPNQAEYMRYSREFELAKMQRRLLEEQVAIANARKNIADTQQQTNKLLGNASNLDDFSKDSWGLTFLSFHNNQWHATIVHDGDYHNVIEGTKLLDGTKILQINKSGILFEYHGMTNHLSFAGIRTVTNHHTASTIQNPSPPTLSAPPMESDQNPAAEPNTSPSIEKKAPAVPTSALPNFQQQNPETNNDSGANVVSPTSEVVTSPSDAVNQLSTQLNSLKSSLQNSNNNPANNS